MKLWSSTANGLQRSRCGEIGSPEREKMPMNRGNYPDIGVIIKGSGIFYE
jgi:hypothetical protein